MNILDVLVKEGMDVLKGDDRSRGQFEIKQQFLFVYVMSYVGVTGSYK